MADTFKFSRKGTKRKASVYEDDTKKSTKKKKKVVESETLNLIQPFNEKTALEGMVVLGCIIEIRNTCLKMALPGCLIGTVSLKNISSPYNMLFQSTNDIEEFGSLHSLFNVGQCFACKILTIKESKQMPNIMLSINPFDVNKDIYRSSLCKNMVINAAVKSIEDQGYIMDTGFDTPGFINKSNVKKKLDVGQVFQTLILDADVLKPAIQLTICNSNKKLQETHDHKLSCFQPGTHVDAIVENTKDHGLLLNIMGFVGYVRKEYLKTSTGTKIEVSGTVLYVHPITHIIYLTLNKVPSLNVFKWKRWDIIENAVVVDIKKDSIYFSVEKNIKCQAMKRELSDKQIDDLSSYSINTAYKCRVLSVHPIDNILRVTLKRSAFKMKIMSPEDLKIGQIVKGKVKKIVKDGIVVKLSSNIQGFVRDLYIHDSFMKSPTSLYKVGDKIICRILSMDFSVSPYSLMLTCKKSLLNTDFPLVSSYSDVFPGAVTKGVIVHLSEKFILISFFNNVQGIVKDVKKDSEGLKKYFIGQIVKCRILYCNPSQKKIHLSLKIDSSEPRSIKLKSELNAGHLDFTEQKSTNLQLDLNAGDIVDAIVLSKAQNGLLIQIQNSKHTAFLSRIHMSDILDHVDNLIKVFVESEALKVLVFSIKKDKIIATRKLSFLQTVKKKQNFQTLSDLQVGKLLPVIVKYYHSGKMLVELGHDIIGYVPLKFTKDNNSSSRYQPGQSLIAKIMKINIENCEIELSTRMSDVYNGDPDYSLDFLQCFLEDKEKLNSSRDGQNGFEVGNIVIAEVCDIEPNYITCKLKNGISAVVSKENCDRDVKQGESYEAVVLFFDYDDLHAELSFSSHLIKCVKLPKNSESSKVKDGQVIKSCAVLIKNEFILVHLGGHAVGSFAYLPSKKIINDEVGRSSLYTLGQHYHIVIKRILNNKILAVLKKHNKLVAHPFQLNTHSVDNIPSSQNASKCAENVNFEKNASHTHLINENIIKLQQKDNMDHPDLESRYPVGNFYDAVVIGKKKFQLNVVINEELQGRVHVTDLGCTEEGEFPMRKFEKGDKINVCITGFITKKTRNYLEISHCYVKKYADCILSTCSRSSSNEEFKIGDDITGFVKEIAEENIILWVTSIKTAELHCLNTSLTIKELRKIKKHYKIGQAVRAKILCVLKNSYQVTKLDTWDPVPGMDVCAFVQSVCPHKGLLAKLPHSYRGEISVNNVSRFSNAIEVTLQKFLKRRFIKCQVETVNKKTKFCSLSLL